MRRSGHRRAGSGAARDVAGLALAVAGGIAADAVDAESARALDPAAARDAVAEVRRADSRSAEVARGAVRVHRAVAAAGIGAANVGGAIDGLGGRAVARAVAARGQRCRSACAGGRAALRHGIGAAPRMDAANAAHLWPCWKPCVNDLSGAHSL